MDSRSETHDVQSGSISAIPLRVLIVEDEEDDALLVIRQLKHGGYEPTYARVQTPETTRAALEESAWDIIIADYNMPQFNGLDALKLYKERGLDIPFIIVSGTIGEKVAVEAMVAGAHDYVMKDNLPRLVPAIARELRETEMRRDGRRAGEALLESEGKFRLLFEKSADAMVLVEKDFFVDCNEAAIIMIGGSRKEDLLSLHPSDISPERQPDGALSRDKEQALIAEAMEKGALRFEWMHRRLNGQAFPVEVSLTSISLSGKQMLHASLRDITDRKKAEEALHASEEKYRSIFEHAVEGIFQSTPEGHFITVNPALANMHGFSSPEEMIASITDMGRQLYVNPEDRRQYRELIETQGAVRNCEAPFCRKDGSTVWVSLSARVLRDDQGKVLCYEGIVEDITGRKEAEARLSHNIENLRKAIGGTIQAIAATVEIRDPYTSGHQREVARLARAIAKEMGLDEERIQGISFAGAIHDLGKISIPAEILSKPGKLTPIEFGLIKVHPQTGYEILKDIEFPWPIATIILQHHERLDGSGYPEGLRDDAILLETRILSVADVVEAMASYRPYRPAIGITEALEEIEKNKGILYDAEVADVCLRLFRENRFTLT